MSVRIRKTLLTITLLLSLTVASACTNFQETVKPKQFLSPMKISHFIVNPLEIRDEPKQQGSGPHDNTFLVSGLKDQKIQEKINDRLRGFYQEIKDRDLPPYRGIRVKIPEGSILLENSLYAYDSFNYNNILSVVVTNNRGYSVPGQDYPHPISVTETLSIDLNTGKELTLKDVFTDDVDYLTLLNRNVSAQAQRSQPEFYGWYEGLRLVTPFKGLSKDQKFHLFPGGIGLVFDYRTPEFDTFFYPITHSLFFSELGEVIALAERYRSDESIFISSVPPVKELLQPRFEGYPPPSQERTFGKVTVHTTQSHPADLPEHLERFMLELSEDYMPLVEELNQGATSSDSWQLNQFVNTRQVGPYLNISRSRSLSGSNNLWEASNVSYCFDEDFVKLSLANLFVPGFDYSIAIRQALQEALYQHGLKQYYSVDDLYSDLHFNIGASELGFFTKPLKFGDQENSNVHSLHFQVLFVVFGCDNMTIFS